MISIFITWGGTLTPELVVVMAPRGQKRSLASALSNGTWIRDIASP
jgi:hypothetical protein